MYTTVKFVRVENNRNITKEDDAIFFFELQRGVLLSLKEAGSLTEMQFRNAELELKEQHRTIIRTKLEQSSKLP